MNLPPNPDVYALCLTIAELLKLQIGRLGELCLTPGYCVYVGSALGPGGLQALAAIFQTNVKRMLAYSSVAQIGYMILGVSLVSVAGLTASISHLFNHALMKGALFMALGCVSFRIGSVQIDRMAGLGRAMPWTMGAFVIGGLSLIGVPLTAGFVSKWYLVVGALEKDWWPVAALVLLTSLMAVVYIWRVVETAYFKPASEGRAVCEAPLALLVPTWTLALANLYFGVETSLNAGVARQAAEMLLGVGQ